MQITVELLLGVGLALCVPLLGVICTCLLKIQSMLSRYTSTMEKVERSLDHNRNEHTKIIGLIEELMRHPS